MKIRKEKKRKGENKFSFEFYSYYSNKVGCLPPLTMEAEQKKKKCKSCGSIDDKSIYSQEYPNHIPLHERARDSSNRMSPLMTDVINIFALGSWQLRSVWQHSLPHFFRWGSGDNWVDSRRLFAIGDFRN